MAKFWKKALPKPAAMSSFIAAGTAYTTHQRNLIPFYIYYSMFGFQRVGDLIWAAGDMRCRGFLLGGTAGRTTLAGEGLQHQDGHSHLIAYSVPNCKAYDPAFAYEISIIVRDGIMQMYEQQKDVFYYITLGNENYEMPSLPSCVRHGILRGVYRFEASNHKNQDTPKRAHLFGSGAIMNCVRKAKTILEENYDIACDTWSITSYKELYNNAIEVDRWNQLHPQEAAKTSFLVEQLKDTHGVYLMASDNVKALPNSIARYFPKTPVCLGTDGFGRSENRENLRDHFEVDERYIVVSTLSELAKEGVIEVDVVQKAIQELKVRPDKRNPMWA